MRNKASTLEEPKLLQDGSDSTIWSCPRFAASSADQILFENDAQEEAKEESYEALEKWHTMEMRIMSYLSENKVHIQDAKDLIES